MIIKRRTLLFLCPDEDLNQMIVKQGRLALLVIGFALSR